MIIISIMVFISSGLLSNVFKSVTVSAMKLLTANDFAATVLYDRLNAMNAPGINLQFMNKYCKSYILYNKWYVYDAYHNIL